MSALTRKVESDAAAQPPEVLRTWFLEAEDCYFVVPGLQLSSRICNLWRSRTTLGTSACVCSPRFGQIYSITTLFTESFVSQTT